MKRMRAVESDSVKSARKAKDKLHKAQVPSCQNRFEDRQGMLYQLESKRHDTIVHETVIDSS